MQPSDVEGPELEGKLADAVTLIKETPLGDSLIARCRDWALGLGEEKSKVELVASESRWHWGAPLTAAAVVLLVINLFQAYARLPGSDCQQAAIRISPEGERFYHFSDLRIEPITH